MGASLEPVGERSVEAGMLEGERAFGARPGLCVSCVEVINVVGGWVNSNGISDVHCFLCGLLGQCRILYIGPVEVAISPQ